MDGGTFRGFILEIFRLVVWGCLALLLLTILFFYWWPHAAQLPTPIYPAQLPIYMECKPTTEPPAHKAHATETAPESHM